MQAPNPSGIASLMGGTSQANTSSQGGGNSGGITNELSALASFTSKCRRTSGIISIN